MPYIHGDRRRPLDPKVHKLAQEVDTPGELNYAITTLCDLVLAKAGQDYAGLNSIIGVLECAKLEFYRRVLAPYEFKKMTENGDVYNVER